MKEIQSLYPNNQEPQHTLKGTVKSEHFEMINVLCKIYLSDKFGEVGFATFNPPSSYSLHDKSSQWPSTFTFNGEEKGAGGWTHTVINIQKAHFSKAETKNKGTDVETIVIYADIWNLLTKRVPHDYSKLEDDHPICRYFMISPVFLLDTCKGLQPQLSGEVTLGSPNKLFFIQLADEFTIEFDTFYKESYGGNGELTLTPYIVGKHELSHSNNDLYDYNKIDDFLLLVSFALRRSCDCLGIDVSFKYSYTNHKRTRLISSDIDTARDRRNALILNRNDFREYIKSAYLAFQKCQHQKLLRDVIGGTLGDWKYTEDEFISLYKSLETLILIFRKEHQLENVLDEHEFNEIKVSIEKTIKNTINSPNSKNQRCLLYKNIKGMNKVPFSEAFSAFQEHYGIKVDDLWPITKGKGSLKVIRNRLVHGNNFKNEEFAALCDATYHLRRLLERCILHYLNCEKQVTRTAIITNQKIQDRFTESFQIISKSSHL